MRGIGRSEQAIWTLHWRPAYRWGGSRASATWSPPSLSSSYFCSLMSSSSSSFPLSSLCVAKAGRDNALSM